MHRSPSPREVELDLGDEVYVGVFVCSHEANERVTAEFDNVRISVPAPDGFVPYRDYIGSQLEIMDVATGVRTSCTAATIRSKPRTGRRMARR